MTSWWKIIKIHYVLKGSHENPGTRDTKKTQQQQKTNIATYAFCLDFVDTFVGKCNGAQARRGWRGPGATTIIIIKEIIRFNNNNRLTQGPPRFLLTRAFYRWAPHPPLRGGSSSSQESPVLPIPSYPALCREDTTSWNHGRPRTHKGLKTHWLPAKHQRLGSIHVLLCKQIMHTRVLHRILANTSELHVHELGKSRGASVKTQFSKCVVILRR